MLIELVRTVDNKVVNNYCLNMIYIFVCFDVID